MLPVLCLHLMSSTTVTIRIEHGRFLPSITKLPADGVLRFENRDKATYTVEAPGLLPGDITLDPEASIDVQPLYEAGRFTAMIEEAPNSETTIDFEGRPVEDSSLRESPFDVARRQDRQPLLFDPGWEPAYGAFSAFNLTVKGEAARQKLLQDLYRLQEELSQDQPPAELAPYFTPASWSRLRPSISLVIGLGSSSYDARRFGPRVAYSRPKALHPLTVIPNLPGGKDVLLRVTSDNYWFNLRLCRLAWARLRGRIANPDLQSGYAPPRGRSPILGGFFDGIGNPGDGDRERAVYHGANGTYLSLFRIRFDEARFALLSAAQQETLVGRRKGSGHIMKGSPTGHRQRAQNDGHSIIVRMPFVFDAGPSETGLLFSSAQASLDGQFERILRGFMMAKGQRDRLLDFMKFESGAYYYVPSSPKGSFPGSLRGF